MKILMVLTSHDRMDDTGNKTGFWLEEFAAPYYVFKDAGADITLASPQGGQPPVDPNSTEPDAQTEDTRRFDGDSDAQAHLARTHRLVDLTMDDFDALFFPGGHGPLWDLAKDPEAIAKIQQADKSGKVIGAVCHAPAVFREVLNDDGEPLVKGRKITGFTNSEEEAVGLTEVVPFLLEDELKRLGADYQRGDDWAEYVVTDGRLITGQNPASSKAAAEAVLKALD